MPPRQPSCARRRRVVVRAASATVSACLCHCICLPLPLSLVSLSRAARVNHAGVQVKGFRRFGATQPRQTPQNYNRQQYKQNTPLSQQRKKFNASIRDSLSLLLLSRVLGTPVIKQLTHKPLVEAATRQHQQPRATANTHTHLVVVSLLTSCSPADVVVVVCF